MRSLIVLSLLAALPLWAQTPDEVKLDNPQVRVVQVTVEPLPSDAKRTLLASDLLQSALVGIWAERGDIGDNREFARRLREQAQRRGPAS